MRPPTFILVLLVWLSGCAQPRSGPKPLDAAELNDRTPVGALGLPLGTCATIRGTIVSGSVLQMKEHAGRYLLRVWEVDGNVLKSSFITEFVLAPGASAKLASDPFDLYELKYDKRVGGLESSEISKLEEGYVGRQVKLTVYETGAFRGIPGNLPDDAMIWQDHPFEFKSWLVVLLERR